MLPKQFTAIRGKHVWLSCRKLMEVHRIRSSWNDTEIGATNHEPLGLIIAYPRGARCANKVRASSDRVFLSVLGWIATWATRRIGRHRSWATGACRVCDGAGESPHPRFARSGTLIRVDREARFGIRAGHQWPRPSVTTDSWRAFSGVPHGQNALCAPCTKWLGCVQSVRR